MAYFYTTGSHDGCAFIWHERPYVNNSKTLRFQHEFIGWLHINVAVLNGAEEGEDWNYYNGIHPVGQYKRKARRSW